jgi:hypothetical protein
MEAHSVAVVLLLQIDYYQAFRDGWVVIADAPIQFFLFLVLVIVGIWLLVYRSFKHNLKMESDLKDGYKERLKIKEADALDTKDKYEGALKENAQLKTELQTGKSENKELKLKLQMMAAEKTALDAEHLALTKLHNGCRAEEKENAKQLELSIQRFLGMQNTLGRWRIVQCANECKSMNSSVAIHFLENESHNRELAETIRRFFAKDHPWSPWAKVEEVQPFKWFKNPSERGRIVIFSKHANAAGIKGAFNDCQLIRKPNEPVTADGNGGHEEVDLFEPIAGMTADITIIVFDQKAQS